MTAETLGALSCGRPAVSEGEPQLGSASAAATRRTSTVPVTDHSGIVDAEPFDAERDR